MPARPLWLTWLACKIRGHRRGFVFVDMSPINVTASMRCLRCGQMGLVPVTYQQTGGQLRG